MCIEIKKVFIQFLLSNRKNFFLIAVARYHLYHEDKLSPFVSNQLSLEGY